MKYFMVIDGGTQNIKAFIFDEKGKPVDYKFISISCVQEKY